MTHGTNTLPNTSASLVIAEDNISITSSTCSILVPSLVSVNSSCILPLIISPPSGTIIPGYLGLTIWLVHKSIAESTVNFNRSIAMSRL